jgi:Secretion system C-terminal sorting domain
MFGSGCSMVWIGIITLSKTTNHMKNIFYLSFLLLIQLSLAAQSPGGLAGSVLWLKANTGAAPAAWTDNSGSGNNFSQATPANQPALGADVFNFNPALQFDGANTYMTRAVPVGFPENSDNRTIFVVAKSTSIAGYRWMFAYGTPGCTPCYATFQSGTSNDGFTTAFYGSELTFPGYWNAPNNINGALGGFVMDAGTGYNYDRGSLLNSNFLGALTATSINGVVGALSPAPAEVWQGDIGEIVFFNTALSTADRNRVESYLALKYGFTLGTPALPIDYTASDGTTKFWTGSLTYQNDVFGIGTDNGTGLVQTKSNSMNSGSGNGTGQNSTGNLVLSSSAPLSDKQFLMIGSDGGFLVQMTLDNTQVEAIAVGSQAVSRNWQVQNTGGTGAVDLSFDATGLSLAGGSNPANYRLMIDQDGDGDYTTGTINYIKPVSITGNLINFTGVTFPANAVFTLITQVSALLPAVWQGFTVSLQKNKATLNWTTSSEVNVDRYIAEYSVNGISFLPFATIAAKNGAGINNYSIAQENVPAGIRYYRITRVDKDGRLEMSSVRIVRAGGLSTVVVKSNPVKARVDVVIDVPQAQTATIRLISTSGKILVQQNNGLSAGSNTISTNISRVTAGTYLLQVQLANEIVNKKIIKL